VRFIGIEQGPFTWKASLAPRHYSNVLLNTGFLIVPPRDVAT